MVKISSYKVHTELIQSVMKLLQILKKVCTNFVQSFYKGFDKLIRGL
jgi:hypothetical protein